VEAAAGIEADTTDAAAVARGINAFLCDQFAYELDDKQVDATQTLAAKRGSCSELSRLYVALARSRGLPARFAAGSRLRADINGYVDAFHHRWVEVFLPNRGWFPVDISLNVGSGRTEGRFGRIPPTYLAMVRNAGLARHALFSSGLALISDAPGLKRRTRTYWFSDDSKPLRETLRLIAGAEASEQHVKRIRDAVFALAGAQSVPMLAMYLHEPLAAGAPEHAMGGLANAGCPAAVVPIIDWAVDHPASTAGADGVLRALTGRELSGAEAWETWLRGEGGAFLRGR
jgi:hypothetical protein